MPPPCRPAAAVCNPRATRRAREREPLRMRNAWSALPWGNTTCWDPSQSTVPSSALNTRFHTLNTAQHKRLNWLKDFVSPSTRRAVCVGVYMTWFRSPGSHACDAHMPRKRTLGLHVLLSYGGLGSYASPRLPAVRTPSHRAADYDVADGAETRWPRPARTPRSLRYGYERTAR